MWMKASAIDFLHMFESQVTVISRGFIRNRIHHLFCFPFPIVKGYFHHITQPPFTSYTYYSYDPKAFDTSHPYGAMMVSVMLIR